MDQVNLEELVVRAFNRARSEPDGRVYFSDLVAAVGALLKEMEQQIDEKSAARIYSEIESVLKHLDDDKPHELDEYRRPFNGSD